MLKVHLISCFFFTLQNSAEDMPDPNVPFTHWFTQVTVNIVDELLEFGYPNVPADIYHRLT